LLVGEPEAFLHPPQARLLGRILAEQHADGTQVVVATHSEDIVQGVTSAAPPTGYDPTIVRLNRRGPDFSAFQISVEKVQQLYDDPLLRHSSVMSGLFYQGVAVCEGDSDCTYHQAVLAHLVSSSTVAARDVNFMHCGGKARIWKELDALRSANVPAVALVDFDVLKSDEILAKLVSVAGGNLDELAADLSVLRQAITARDVPVKTAAARAEIDAVFDKVRSAEVTDGLRNSVTSALLTRNLATGLCAYRWM